MKLQGRVKKGKQEPRDHHQTRHSPNALFATERLCYTAINERTILHENLSLAHLSQRLIGELIGYSWSGVRLSVRRRRPSVRRRRPSVRRRRPQCSKIFFSETALPIIAKFYVEPPWVRERCFVRGIWVTWPRWPPRPYMLKTLQKSSPEPAGRFPRNLVCSIGDSSLS